MSVWFWLYGSPPLRSFIGTIGNNFIQLLYYIFTIHAIHTSNLTFNIEVSRSVSEIYIPWSSKLKPLAIDDRSARKCKVQVVCLKLRER